MADAIDFNSSGRCEHLNCADRGTVVVTTQSGKKGLWCTTHFQWSYVENPTHTKFSVEKLDGFDKQFRRRTLEAPPLRHELN